MIERSQVLRGQLSVLAVSVPPLVTAAARKRPNLVVQESEPVWPSGKALGW